MTLYAHYDPNTSKILQFIDTDALNYSVIPKPYIDITAQEFAMGYGWVIDGVFSDSAPIVTDAQVLAIREAAAWSIHQIAAKDALEKSDITVLRCAESGIAVPAAWANYRKSLRALVGSKIGDASKPLPEIPEYPSGI